MSESSKVTITDDGTLEIEGLANEDEGMYACKVTGANVLPYIERYNVQIEGNGLPNIKRYNVQRKCKIILFLQVKLLNNFVNESKLI